MLPERFWNKVEKTATCWLWTAGTTRNGYAMFHLDRSSQRRTVYAHKFAYEALVALVPAGLDLDHLCRTRRCVNPLHLEPVTRAENVARGMEARNGDRDLCPQGHQYDAENTYLRPDYDARNCKECRREATRQWRARNRQAS